MSSKSTSTQLPYGSNIYYQYDEEIVDDSSGIYMDDITSDNSGIGVIKPEKSSGSSMRIRNVEYKELIEQRKSDTIEFRNLIVILALAIVTLGILANLLFNFIVLFRRRRRQTSSTLLMFSICCAYLLYLVVYCFRISNYFDVNKLVKFHIYDTIDNWSYGAFMCKFVSAMPQCCKLIARLSILAIVLKRVLACLLFGHNNAAEGKATNETSSGVDESHQNHQSQSLSGKLEKIVRKLFECPILIVIIALIWVASLIVSYPMFASYQLSAQLFSSASASEHVCDSVFVFPDDIDKYGSLSFNYLVYTLILPSTLTFFLLILLFVSEKCCILRSSCCCSTSGNYTTTSSTDATSSTTSFDESSNSSNSSTGPGKMFMTPCMHRTRNSHLFLWTLFLVHVLTTLPQEVYKYIQLRVDYNDDDVLDAYLMSNLAEPLTKARPYYALQLLYVSEFAIMPVLFILFYLCSTSIRERPTRSAEAAALSPNMRKCDCICLTQSSVFKHARSFFYDGELAMRSSKRSNFLNFAANSSSATNSATSAHFKSSRLIKNNDTCRLQNEALLAAANGDNCGEHKKPPMPYDTYDNHHHNSMVIDAATAAELAASGNAPNNLVHIVQHPSWRINIRQAGTGVNAGSAATASSPNTNNTINNSNSNLTSGVQLPFNYMKTSMYKS